MGRGSELMSLVESIMCLIVAMRDMPFSCFCLEQLQRSASKRGVIAMDFLMLFLSLSFIGIGLKFFGAYRRRVAQSIENPEDQSSQGSNRLIRFLDSIEIAIVSAISICLGGLILIALVKKHIL